MAAWGSERGNKVINNDEPVKYRPSMIKRKNLPCGADFFDNI